MANKYIQDAGHGGTDPGASKNGHVEKVYTLEAASYVDRRLKELGISSTMTRTSDVTLDSVPRTNIVKKSGATVCLSHHFNAGGGDGTETIHSIHSNGKLATIIAKTIAAAGVKFRRVFTKKYNNNDYFFMHRLTGSVQTVIVEYEFLDGPNHAKLKDKSFREQLYEATVKAVCSYEGVKYVPVGQTSKPSTPTPKPKPVAPKPPAENSELYKAIEYVKELGISDGSNPQDPLTRGQFFRILYRQAQKGGGKS